MSFRGTSADDFEHKIVEDFSVVPRSDMVSPPQLIINRTKPSSWRSDPTTPPNLG